LPEVTGLLIPPGYPEAISEAVLKLLGDPQRRERMGIAARAWICERFSNERVLRLAVSFYINLLKPRQVNVHKFPDKRNGKGKAPKTKILPIAS